MSRFFHAVLLALCTWSLAGCGLADYEQRMDRHRARLRVFDEEHKYLDELIEPPPRPAKDGVPAFPFEIYLRLPRDISSRIAERDGIAFAYDLFVARYPGSAPGFNVFVAASFVRADGQLKSSDKADWTAEEFRDSFRLAVNTISKKLFREPVTERRILHPTSPSEEKLAELSFNYSLLEEKAPGPGATTLELYVHQKGNRIIGLGFQVPQANKSDVAVQKGIDFCLKSLDISERAAGKRQAYVSSKRVD